MLGPPYGLAVLKSLIYLTHIISYICIMGQDIREARSINWPAIAHKYFYVHFVIYLFNAVLIDCILYFSTIRVTIIGSILF